MSKGIDLEYQLWLDDIEALEKLAERFSHALDTAKENYAQTQNFEQKNNAGEGVRYSFEGKTSDGRSIYKSNYPLNTPKSVKSQDIINLVKNVWSKQPVKLTIIDERTKTQKVVIAKFNPVLTQRSDLSKIAFGNRKGNASEKRITLNLSSDFYQIAQESEFVKSKKETGKDNPAHDKVSIWHYFVTNLVYREEGAEDIDCYMNIDVKENDEGDWFYSFAIEKGTAPQTLLAVVTESDSATVPEEIIPQTEGDVNNSSNENVVSETENYENNPFAVDDTYSEESYDIIDGYIFIGDEVKVDKLIENYGSFSRYKRVVVCKY